MTVQTTEDPERLALSREAAKALAFSMVGTDPFQKEIQPSLMSAHDIDRYVMATGLISPYFTGGGRHGRLKKASYEGRIGNSAWFYDARSNKLTDCWNSEKLTVPANTIVFVECDLDFRLPNYIGLRFNLQIRHVHRGLLLGTGPLVDPGYWGKLCIPLHNLTNEPYEIPLNEGLIWVEFTKTTSPDRDDGRPALSISGPKHPDEGHWEIREFITKAAQPFDKTKSPIAIRSSIQDQANQSTNSANEAARLAREAQNNADDAKKSAERAQTASQDVKAKVENYGLIGAAAAVVTVMGIWASFYFGVRADISSLNTRVDTVIGADDSTKNVPQAASSAKSEGRLRSDIDNLRYRLDEVARENVALKAQLESLLKKP